MKEIRGESKTIRQLLGGTRYSIDYYQREYKWQPKQVRELVDDLTTKFLEDHREGDDRAAVQNYGHYFLGSIILSRKGNDSFIIDGQQRLTTLTLLLIFLHNRQGARPDRVKLEDLIFSEKYARKSFNIDVPERTPAMEALFNSAPLDTTERPESVRNIVARYSDIEQAFPQEINGNALPYFADWLIENVHLVEITAYSDDDAYTIFETMNDRGLSLSPLDMLKGYLLANIGDSEMKLRASKAWKDRVGALGDVGKDEDADAFKAWLRSQYANSIRERKKGAHPQDFDRLGTEFHRWVKDHSDAIGLRNGADFARFIERDMAFYTRQYMRVREASQAITPGLEPVYYNALFEFTLQYSLLLAPLIPEDDEATIDRKLNLVATFLDILIARRLWNSHSIAYSTMQYAMFLVMRDIRRLPVEELASYLLRRLGEEEETFASNDRLRVHQQNRWPIQVILARITDHIERESGMPCHFEEYVSEGRNRYEVEHIWADHPERHLDEFGHKSDFEEYRNRIGGLLLLPKSFNSSYGDLTYEKKLTHYFGQNLLAKSLHPSAYEHHPGFVNYVRASGLPFHSHAQFKKADLDERHALYRMLAERVWDPTRIETILTKV